MTAMEHTCEHCVGVGGFMECGGDPHCHCMCGTPLPLNQQMAQDPETGKWSYLIPRPEAQA